MTCLVLVRHGESTWNWAGFYQGRTDTDLSEVGCRQAALLARHLAGTRLDAIYSSPLKRALETAQAVGRAQGAEVLIEPGLTEIDHGDWSGLHKSEVEERFPDTLHLWLRQPTRAVIPGGESLSQVQGRVQAALARIVLGHPNQTVMICTHDAVLKVAIITALGLGLDSFWAIRVDNASISVLEHDGHRGRLMLLNDTCYLGQERSDSTGQAL